MKLAKVILLNAIPVLVMIGLIPVLKNDYVLMVAFVAIKRAVVALHW